MKKLLFGVVLPLRAPGWHLQTSRAVLEYWKYVHSSHRYREGEIGLADGNGPPHQAACP
jgi:hypothetical protein